jgi:hypothetical protein
LTMQYVVDSITLVPPALKPATFRLDPGLLDGLKQVKTRDGIPVTEQVRRAILAWLNARGIEASKADRRRVAARKRS